MARNTSAVLVFDSLRTQSFVLPAGSGVNLDIDLTDCFSAKALICIDYGSLSGTSGVTCNVFDGFGPEDPNSYPEAVPCKLGTIGATAATAGSGADPTKVTFATNNTSVTMATPVASSRINTSLFFSDPEKKNPRWQRLALFNTDTTNNVTIAKILLDI